LRGTDILSKRRGKYKWSADYKLTYTEKNELTGEGLQNKGKLAKSDGIFKHINDGAYSDAWVSCRENKYSMYLFKCFNNGTFEINGKTGDEIRMPNCDPIGCEVADLGPGSCSKYKGKIDTGINIYNFMQSLSKLSAKFCLQSFCKVSETFLQSLFCKVSTKFSAMYMESFLQSFQCKQNVSIFSIPMQTII